MIPKLEIKAQIKITQMGVPTVFPQGNRVSHVAKNTAIHRVPAMKSGSWVKVMVGK
jgi:hypothetical protein